MDFHTETWITQILLMLLAWADGIVYHRLDDATFPGHRGGREITYARCIIVPDVNPNLKGVIDFRETTDWWAGNELTIRVNVSGFNSMDRIKKHGIHIHEFGDLTQGCTSAGGHYNPLRTNHGAPYQNKQQRHVGDLGNVEEDHYGNVQAMAQDKLASLTGRFPIVGRAVVIHEKEDDLGKGGDAGSRGTGNAGRRLGCCVIALASNTHFP